METISSEMRVAAEALSKFDAVVVQGSIKKAKEEAGASSSDLWKFPVESIHVEPGFNVRLPSAELDQHIRALADSIKANGFFAHSPLAGYVKNVDGKHVLMLTDGHCRLKAVKLAIQEGAEIGELPVVASSQGTNIEDLTAALVVKNTGKRLTSLERGIVVKRLLLYNWDQEKITQKTGISAAEIDSLMVLMSAPQEIRGMVERGEVAAKVAVAEIREKGSGAVESIKKMKAVAKVKGHAKVTSRHRDGATIKKVLRKQGEAMLDALREIRSDVGYSVLAEDLKEKIGSILSAFESALAKEGEVESEAQKVGEGDGSEELTAEQKALVAY